MTDKQARNYAASIPFDRRLYRQDIEGSIARARMLAKQEIIAGSEAVAIIKGLNSIRKEIERGRFQFRTEFEDIHMNIEARMFEKIGDVAGKLHTARSRNDQDGESFVMRDNLYGWPERWSLPDADMLTAREAMINMFDALTAGDYQTAARLFQPSPEDMKYLTTTGFDPTDLQEVLAGLCAQEFEPCSMEYQIRFGGMEPYVAYQGDSKKSYYFIVTFTTVDGSIYRDPYEQTEFQIYVDFLPDDSVGVITLPYFFYGIE